jgi:hypothetical protein
MGLPLGRPRRGRAVAVASIVAAVWAAGDVRADGPAGLCLEFDGDPRAALAACDRAEELVRLGGDRAAGRPGPAGIPALPRELHGSQSPRADLELARALHLLRLGDTDRARVALYQAVAADPDMEGADAIRRILGRLNAVACCPESGGAEARREAAEWAAVARDLQPAAERLAARARALEPVRDFIVPGEIPPAGVGAYGMVAFTHKPTPTTRDRFAAICHAFLSTLPPRRPSRPAIPPDRLMITYWPLEERKLAAIARGDCDHLTTRYDLRSGLAAIRDADQERRHLAERRGPFLIGWSPAESRYERDAVVLVMDLSDLDSEASFREAFQAWRTRITEDPSLWRDGFSVDQIRLALRDFLDRYGASILKAIWSE